VALLGYSFGFLVLLGIVAWMVFPRLMRWTFIALCVFVGVAWLMGSLPDKTTAQHQERPR
jgi:Flp pilus assembly protein TadB